MRVAAPLVILLTTAACAPAEEATSCDAVVKESLVNGTSDETYLGLAERQASAVLRIDDGTPGGPMCTGTVVGDHWIITARHCLSIANARAVVTSSAAAELALPVMATFPNPDRDLALLQVAGSWLELGADVQPLQVAGTAATSLSSGDVVVLAGYGNTESGAAGARRFVTEELEAIDDTFLRVDGHGRSGACDGDSGGPLLIRGLDGQPTVAGVLSGGSSSCVGVDRYVRLEPAAAWLTATMGSPAAPDTECGSIDAAGRCLFGRPVWCAAAQLVVATCSSGTRCGWSDVDAGFRCVGPQDPCEGVDRSGACRDGDALTCAGGALRVRRCIQCGMACARDSRTGAASCVDVPTVE